MSIPPWYRTEALIWLFTGLPFQFFFTDFNGIPFLSLPDLPGPNGLSVGPWLLLIVFLYHPILMGPVAIWQSRLSK